MQAKAAANLILNLSSDDPAASWALYGELQVLAAAHPGEDRVTTGSCRPGSLGGVTGLHRIDKQSKKGARCGETMWRAHRPMAGPPINRSAYCNDPLYPRFLTTFSRRPNLRSSYGRATEEALLSRRSRRGDVFYIRRVLVPQRKFTPRRSNRQDRPKDG